LRAIEAFLMTAGTYVIPVLFTFFAFLPETWGPRPYGPTDPSGGVNPYLDPVALHAQKEFVARIARRFSMVNDVMWDFINEPSFCSQQQLWLCRPNYDDCEKEAWTAWLKER